MKKNILILSDKDDWQEDQPDFIERHRFSYNFWGEYCIHNDITLTRAYWNWFGENNFKKYWKYIGKGNWLKINENFIPNIVYDKCANLVFGEKKDRFVDIFESKRKISSACKFLNYLEFNNLFTSKLNQAIIFRDFISKTKVVRKGEIINNPSQKKIVLKDFFGSGGFNVKILDDKEIRINKDCLLQDFVDGRENGKLRDYRVLFVGEEMIYAVSRIAEKGNDYTNIHQGASVEFIGLSEISDILEKCKLLLKKLEYFKYKNFSLDFLKENKTGKIYLMEMNTKPGVGFFNEKTKSILENYLEKLTKHLLSF